MAEKENTGGTMFERAGRAMGSAEAGYEAPVDFLKGMKQGADFAKSIQDRVKANKQKDKDLLKNFPEGINVLKVPESFQPQLKNWLVGKREEYAAAAGIIAKGKNDPGYFDAVDRQNLIKEQYQTMSKQLEGGAALRADILNRQEMEETKIGSGRSLTMNNFQDTNFSNLAQENYGSNGLNLRIDPETNDLIVTNAQGKDIKWGDLDSGKGYDGALVNSINQTSEQIIDLAHKPNFNEYFSKHRDSLQRKYKESLETNPKAVIEAMFNEPDFEDERDRYIAQEVGMEYGSDEFNNFKEGGLDFPKLKYETAQEAMALDRDEAIEEIIKYQGRVMGLNDEELSTLANKLNAQFDNDKAGFYGQLQQVEEVESYASIMEDMKDGNINKDVFMGYLMESFDNTFNETREKIKENPAKGKKTAEDYLTE